ncbi:MAG: hypothetical protein JWQ07_2821 [Ramlibacter sp.]|nr:hypothetical protein [Ramlibacter sp.]
MNRNIASALVLAAAMTGNAFADDITVDHTPFIAQKSRAEVQAELAQFKAAGVNPWATSYNQLAGFASAKSRLEVASDYIASREAVSALNGEDSGSAYLAKTAARPTAILLAHSSVTQ